MRVRDRFFRPVEIGEDQRTVAKGERKAGIEGDGAIERAERRVVVAGELCKRQTGKIQHPGVVAAGCDRLSRHAHPLLDIGPLGRNPVPVAPHHLGQRQPRHRRCIARIAFEGAARQLHRFAKPSRVRLLACAWARR